jgi:hypothetical protein
MHCYSITVKVIFDINKFQNIQYNCLPHYFAHHPLLSEDAKTWMGSWLSMEKCV